ncbi:MAG TPA: DUF222 domain-containing protein [Streptosporangiaceae bacterium]|nr:DUF222 domain-containing protein [Streptosporangiaceae bacterium]
MPQQPDPVDLGRDDDLAWLDRDPMTAAEREAYLDRVCEQDEPPEEEEYEDVAPLTAEELAEISQAARDDLLAVQAATTGRRGPGQPGSARMFPGESASPAAGFGPGMPLDVLPGCPGLALAADAAAGDDGFAGVSDAELIGLLCAWDRVEAHAAARKLAAIAELARRNPGPEDAEFAADQLACALADSRGHAGGLMELADSLETRLPGTKAALLDGTISRFKAEIIAGATALLDPDEARAAEDKVLDRAARLTPGALRAAIARAVIEVAPEKARQRRERAAKDARVERWLEDSGNAALMGCELPPDEVLAADQRITWWAHELKKAGLDGGMDQLRARAYLDLLLGQDSRPRPGGAEPAANPPAASPAGGAVPAGFAGRVTLTAPLVTLTRLAGRPGELAGLGPVDPWLTRDLATAAARSPKTTWCVTVTDEHGHAIGHGCARPAPRSQRKRAGPGPPGETGFTFTPASRDGPPGGYGTWTLRTPGPGPDLIVALDPITTDPCDHRHQAKGHDPGVRLRHLSQIRHATCTSPVCRRPAAQCDHEHNTPYEAGGRSCLCNTGPKCRHDHRLKQHPRWTVDQLPDGTFRWTTPSGRSYDAEPTRYPV